MREKNNFCKKEFIHLREHICESKKKEIKFWNKLSMKVNLFVEFNREKWVSKNITLTTILIFTKLKLWHKTYPTDTGRKLNVHKTFRRCPGRGDYLWLLNWWTISQNVWGKNIQVKLPTLISFFRLEIF